MNICEKFRSINLESNLYFQIFYIKQIKHFGKIFFDDLAKYFEICFQIFGKEDEARGLTLDRVLKKNTNTCVFQWICETLEYFVWALKYVEKKFSRTECSTLYNSFASV